VAGLKRRTGRHSKVLWLLGGSFAFDIIITVVLAVTGVQVLNQSSELEHVQEVTSDDVLCPLYEIFVTAAKAPPPPPNPGEKPDAYKQRMEDRSAALKTISEGYVILDCKPSGEKKQ
jgi:hypothetical protein